MTASPTTAETLRGTSCPALAVEDILGVANLYFMVCGNFACVNAAPMAFRSNCVFSTLDYIRRLYPVHVHFA
ncbi:hypothetical protein M0657_003225 [Pyricularia oryzae]|nr:hypothetical protein M9X92_005932 [Pyricularia oryzae]KAI7927403.1 hypothetical protein M0657_003225 [Pyricularia oryzae]